MQQFIKKISLALFAAALVSPVTLLAQKEEKEKKEKKEAEQIIITRKGDKAENITIEIKGDKITVNGKAIDDKDGNISVRRNNIRDVYAFNGNLSPAFRNSWSNDDAVSVFGIGSSNRPMLGVTTEKVDKGVEIKEITKESGAEKAGLKAGDVITKIGDKEIDSPDELSAAIQAKKDGDKVSVTYLRDNKEQKVTAELSKWKGLATSLNYGTQNYDLKFPELETTLKGLGSYNMPRVRVDGQNYFNWSGGGGPKLGLSVQDTEDGKGVAVLDVDDEGNAFKAGIKEDDIITEVDGKSVNSADEIAKIMKESKEKVSVKVKLLRAGKTESVEVKIPRRLKTADL